MADASRIVSWILPRATELHLQVEETTWLNAILPSLTDLCIEMKIQGRKITGRATGETEDIALTKATAEAIERVVMHEQSFETSSGMAAHVSAETAIRNAECELLERDLFLCHFLSKTPFERMNEIPNHLLPLTNWFEAQSIRVLFFELGNQGSLCLIDGRNAHLPFGFVVSTAIKESLKESITSTAVCAARKAHRHITRNNENKAISLEEFQKIPSPSFSHHGQLALNIEYANKISDLFYNAPPKATPSPQVTTIETKLHQPVNPLLKDCPAIIARATSEDSQNIFLGFPKPEKINLQRLSSFAGRPLSWSDINHLPHPFD